MGGSAYFTTLDLTSGYYNVGVREADKHKTAFTTPFGLYEFQRCPMGISNAVPTFQRTMEKMLRGLLGVCALVYLDDVILFSPTFEDHVTQLDQVLRCIGEAGMALKIKKCNFFEDSVSYLGHIISDQGIRACPDKVAAITEFPVPEGKGQVRSFLGIAGFYRRFIRGFSQVARPLFDLTKKLVKWAWPPAADAAFIELKRRMTSAPVLRYPDFTRPFQINVDACNVGGGAVLTQIGEAGHPHVVAFWSTVFSGAELNYGTVEKECCALVKAVIHFRPYIFGRPVTVFTDHAPLQWLSSIADPAGRLLRWSLMLSDYDITIKYRKGSENNDADGLSRAHVREVLLCPGVVQGGDPRAECGCPLGTCEGEAPFSPSRAPPKGDRGKSTLPDVSEAPTPPHQVGLELQEASSKEPLPLTELIATWLAHRAEAVWEGLDRSRITQDIATAQRAEPSLTAYFAAAREAAAPRVSGKRRRRLPPHAAEQFVVDNGVLYHLDALPKHGALEGLVKHLVAPASFRPTLLHMAHDDPLTGGHLAVTKVFAKLKARYWWPHLYNEAKAHCEACVECGTAKGRVGHAPFASIPLPQRPWEMLGIDTVGPLPVTADGNRYIVVITDYLTRWVEATAVPTNDAAAIAKVLFDTVPRHGYPERILSDRGTEYVNEVVTHLLALGGTAHVQTPAYRPQTNGLT